MEAHRQLGEALTGRNLPQFIRVIRLIRGLLCTRTEYTCGRGGAVMKTIETTITVLPDGSIQIPPAAAPADERQRATEALRTAGLLAELSPEEKALAAQSTLTLEEARAILDRAGGKPLSEIILEMRGPKE